MGTYRRDSIAWRRGTSGGIAALAAALLLASCGGAAGGASVATSAGTTNAESSSATAIGTTAASNAGNTAAQSAGEMGAAGSIPSSCTTPPNAVAYRALAEHRPDVLRFYAQNGWDTQAKCHAVYDDWLKHGPDGKPPTTAPAFVAAQGWAAPAASSSRSTTTTATK